MTALHHSSSKPKKRVLDTACNSEAQGQHDHVRLLQQELVHANKAREELQALYDHERTKWLSAAHKDLSGAHFDAAGHRVAGESMERGRSRSSGGHAQLKLELVRVSGMLEEERAAADSNREELAVLRGVQAEHLRCLAQLQCRGERICALEDALDAAEVKHRAQCARVEEMEEALEERTEERDAFKAAVEGDASLVVARLTAQLREAAAAAAREARRNRALHTRAAELEAGGFAGTEMLQLLLSEGDVADIRFPEAPGAAEAAPLAPAVPPLPSLAGGDAPDLGDAV